MTDAENTAVMEKEKEVVNSLEAPPPPAPPPEAPPAPGADTVRLEALLRQIEEQSLFRTQLAKKQLFWGRLTALFMGVMAATVVFTVSSVLPQVESVLGTASSTMDSITRLSMELQGADIPAILENLDQALTEGRASMADASEAMQSVSSIDFASLNAAILDLQRVLENPLGSLFGRR